MSSPGLVAVESFFGAGITVAPMEAAIGGLDAMLFRYLPAMQDDWSGGLHLAGPPDLEQLTQALSTWKAFEAPGRLRWPASPDWSVDPDALEVVTAAGFVLTTRPILVGSPSAGAPPTGVTVSPIVDDIRDWAGFEVLARWIDPDVDPDRWRWRAKRVRHLVEGGRGRAWLARTSSAPVGAVVVLDPPAHRPDHAPAVGVVVHQAHRGRGVASALFAQVAAHLNEPVTVLGPVVQTSTATGGTRTLRTLEVVAEVHRAAEPAVRRG